MWAGHFGVRKEATRRNLRAADKPFPGFHLPVRPVREALEVRRIASGESADEGVRRPFSPIRLR